MKQVETIDLRELPELECFADRVQASGTPLLLQKDNETVAVLRPARSRYGSSDRRSRPLREDDPLFQLIGIGHSGIPGGASGRKHEQLARAYRPS
jgi:hypothetical protein